MPGRGRRSDPAPSLGFVQGYHLTTFEHGISSIGLKRLKVARFFEVNDMFELFALDCMDRGIRAALKEFKAEQDRTMGVLCFSADWKSPVLWSHYAAGERGICLGFDIRETLGIETTAPVAVSPGRPPQ